MWILVRGLALLVLATTGLLVVGRGEVLLDAIDAWIRWGGTGDVVARSDVALRWQALAGGMVVGLVAASLHPVSRVVGQVVTLLHELGHTVTAAALGARPSGIVLRHDASGHATARWVGRPTPGRRVALAAVAFAGVPAAAVTAAAGAQLLLLAGPEAVLWSLAATGLTVAVLARSAWSLLVAGGLAALALGALHDAVAPWTVGIAVATLVAIATATTRQNLRGMRRRLPEGDDARVVGRQLRVPARSVQLTQVVVAATLNVWALWSLITAS